MKLSWIPFPDSVFSLQQEMTLARLGKLLVAHHHGGEHVVMMVKLPDDVS